jgi:hypothetical protein
MKLAALLVSAMSQKQKSTFGLLGLGLILSLGLNAQNSNWQLKKNKAGIKVYTRMVEGFALDEFKGEMVLNTSLNQVKALIKNAAQMPEWVPDCKEAKLLKKEGESQIHYSITTVPFPLDNRDAIIRYDYITNTKGLKITLNGLPDYLPKNDGLVRIPFLQGFYLLEEINANQIKITYQVQANPGGSIPTWMANTFAVDNPFNTLKNLRDYLL